MTQAFSLSGVRQQAGPAYLHGCRIQLYLGTERNRHTAMTCPSCPLIRVFHHGERDRERPERSWRQIQPLFSMRYTSTRGRSISVSFETAICTGYASDGGLFVPETLPSITPKVLAGWSGLSYPDLAFAILRSFIHADEIANADLKSICNAAMGAFEDPGHAVPVVKVGGLYVAELFRGPTFCFKDLGMRVLIGLLSHFVSKRPRQSATLIVSTTGDTGPAAVQAVADARSKNLSLLVHYPHGQISDFQRRQLTTVYSPRVKVVAYEGGGDDMDLPIKRMLSSPCAGTTWTGVNSYNVGRPLMQLVHYVWTYLRVIQAEAATKGTSSACDYSQSITFVIPTGAMGNIAGGYMAKQMGLPIRKLVVAVNANDASHRVIQTGQLQKKPLIRTLSEAMNIQIPYNLERLLFYRTSQNHELISQWMKEVDSRASLDLTSWLEKLREDFDSAAASDSQVCEAIATVLSRFQYYMDPHTAVGWSAADQLGYTASPLGSQAPSTGGSSPVVLLATASPCKFENAYSTALGPEGWKAYVASSEYPVAARRISECTEVPPIMYSAEPTLEASQTAWERQAREIVRKLEQAAT